MGKKKVYTDEYASRFTRQSVKPRQRLIGVRFLVVSEGEKTEPSYLKAFQNKERGVYVRVVGTGTNTRQVVDEAIKLKNAIPGSYDMVWAVFDKDSFSDADFNAAIQKADSNGIGAAWSNEAFELWYLYHFQNRVTAMSRENYKKAISNAVNASPKFKSKKPYVYKKNADDNFEIMNEYGSLKNAIAWSEAKSKEYTDRRYATQNPCTMVYKLVRQLLREDVEFEKALSRKI